jgi:hypothetical protein
MVNKALRFHAKKARHQTVVTRLYIAFPWTRKTNLALEANPLNKKCCHRASGGLQAVRLLLATRGGEGKILVA